MTVPLGVSEFLMCSFLVERNQENQHRRKTFLIFGTYELGACDPKEHDRKTYEICGGYYRMDVVTMNRDLMYLGCWMIFYDQKDTGVLTVKAVLFGTGANKLRTCFA